MQRSREVGAGSPLGVGAVVVTVIVVLSRFMAPEAHWLTYVLAGAGAAGAFAATTVVLRRRRQGGETSA